MTLSPIGQVRDSGPVHHEVDRATEHWFVVADRFRDFGQDSRVKTVSGVCAAIGSGEFDDMSSKVLLHPAQGVTAYEGGHVEAMLERRGLKDCVRLVDDCLEIAGRDVVHKHRSENVLLMDLRREGEHGFRAALRVHGDNELLMDHQSGEHVQGMVVVEAARQMFLAVFEIGYRHRWPLREYNVIWNSVRLTFENFLFPLPAEVMCILRELSIDENKLEFEMLVEIQQAGRRVVEGTIGFTSFDSKRIRSVERGRAAQALDSCLDLAASRAESAA